LLWIARKLGSSSSSKIAEIAKIGNVVGICGRTLLLLLLLRMFVIDIITIFSKNGLIISVFKLRRLITSQYNLCNKHSQDTTI
jgi:hypothetical protein